MKFTNDKEAFDSDRREQIHYQQKIARAKNELKKRLPPRAFKRKELWEQNRTKWQVIKIQANDAWRKFDLKTRGMGLMLVVLLGAMMIANFLPAIVMYSTEQMDKTKYNEALKTSCLNAQFYAWNFRSCENVNVRPFDSYTPQAPEIRGEQA